MDKHFYEFVNIQNYLRKIKAMNKIFNILAILGN